MRLNRARELDLVAPMPRVTNRQSKAAIFGRSSMSNSSKEAVMDRSSRSNSSFLLPVLLLATTAAIAEGLTTVMPGCQGSCGGVDIPYPYGIGSGCFRKGFEICVNNDSAGDKPVLATTSQDIRVLNLSMAPRPEARVSLPVAWQCFNSSGYRTGGFSGDVNVNPDGVYRISNTHNELYVLGCNTLAYTNSGVSGNDSSDPQDGACAGIGCCRGDIPPGLTDNSMTLFDDSFWSHKEPDFSYDSIMRWAIDDNGTTSMSCVQAANWSGYACASRHSECINSTNGHGYTCKCSKGYEGNPYIVDGCTDVDECTKPDLFPCYGICTNIVGSYHCKCKPGYESNGADPKKKQCHPKLSDGADPKKKQCHPKFSHSATIASGINVGAFGLIVTLLVAWLMFKHKELKEKKRELEAIAKNNGSDILKNVKTLKIFTKEEINDITENNTKYLGRGAFGKVYKGTLPNKTDVAVKESIEVTKDTKDEIMKEVEIQSRMMHRNILKLLGCCLRVDRPLLVYEYATKGSLQDILHGNNETQQPQPLPLNSRLNIAIGSAQGLAYMHTYTESGIQHADVKPSNILLDGELVPKISDFGLSKVFMAGRQYTKDIVGCLDYMDPMSIVNNRLTPKSDVYSFGIVLLELICRKPVVFGKNRLILEFKRVFDQDKSGKAMLDMEIAQEENIPLLDEIGILAMKCLNENFEERPAMESVASELVILRDTWETKKKTKRYLGNKKKRKRYH